MLACDSFVALFRVEPLLLCAQCVVAQRKGTGVCGDKRVCDRVHMSTCADDDITMTHKVVPGMSSASFGIHVARIAGVPDDVVSCAKEVEAQLSSERAKRQRVV